MTGYVPDGDELKKGYVYITPHEAVYHKDLSCTHLSLDISVDEDVENIETSGHNTSHVINAPSMIKVIFSVCILQKKGNLITRILVAAG